VKGPLLGFSGFRGWAFWNAWGDRGGLKTGEVTGPICQADLCSCERRKELIFFQCFQRTNYISRT
jgi:hypothetical protein